MQWMKTKIEVDTIALFSMRIFITHKLKQSTASKLKKSLNPSSPKLLQNLETFLTEKLLEWGELKSLKSSHS